VDEKLTDNQDRDAGSKPRFDADTQEPAQAPQRIPVKAWFGAVKRTQPRLKALNIPLLAAGVAFWSLLSIFPGLLALVSVYGLVSSPADVTTQVENALGAVSEDSKDLIGGQLKSVAAGESATLGFGLLLALALLLWSASGGMQNLMTAVTTAYEQEETRGFVKLRGIALALTVGALVMAVIVLGAIGVVPPLVDRVVGSGALKLLLVALEFVVLFALVVGAITVLYRFAPANKPVGFRWASSGALIAAVLWLLGTIAFAVYVQNFSKFGNTYGALAGVIIFMLWLYLTSFVVLVGALVNAEAERGVKGNAESEPEGVARDVLRQPDEERAERRLRPPEEARHRR